VGTLTLRSECCATDRVALSAAAQKATLEPGSRRASAEIAKI
jgi:hypothetical protein